MPGYLLARKPRTPKPQGQRRFIASTLPVQLQTSHKLLKKSRQSKHLPVTPSTNPKVIQLMSISADTAAAVDSRGLEVSDAAMVLSPSKTGGELLRF